MGGGGPDPVAAAEKAEKERQERIKAATETINSVFADGGREKLYTDQQAAVYDLNKAEVDRQAVSAERSSRFGLARQGLLGSSTHADGLSEINRRTNEGLLQAGGMGLQAAADLRTADERTRSNLISMAQSGIDTGTAAQQALAGLQVNAENVAAQRKASTIGSLFGDMQQAYLAGQQQQGMQAGWGQGSSYGRVSAPQTTYGGTVRG